jgi:hypothetical protein
MKLKVHSVENKGDLDKEVVWLEVIEPCDLSYYIIADNTYTAEGKISNELRHVYWFPSRNVAKGDYIALRTTNGSNTTTTNDRKTTTYIYYWNLGHSVWNKDGDCAVLFKLTTWNTTRV